MRKVLVIGSTVVDVLIEVEALPTSGSDKHTRNHTIMLGGCAYNVHKTLDYYNIPHTLFSPVGSGIYGQYVKDRLNKDGLEIAVEVDEENGCCYCFVEPSGERSFISHHGAEYKFKKEWFDKLQINEYSFVYLCGLEIEEDTGINIIEFIEDNPQLEIFFAPGPRVKNIEPQLINRLLKHGVILHLNASELKQLAKEDDIDCALRKMHQVTNKPVIVTLGDLGAKVINDNCIISASSNKVQVVNTNGAGDSHIGAVIANIIMSKNWKETIEDANVTAGMVVASKQSHME